MFGLNAAMEKFCPLVIASECTSVSLWGIAPNPSADRYLLRGLGVGVKGTEKG